MTLMLSDERHSATKKVMIDSESTKSGKALQVVKAAQQNRKQDCKLGLLDPATRQMDTPFEGL